MNLYGADITAAKIVPVIAPLALDPDKNVRKAALQCLRISVAKIEKFSEQMPDAPVAAPGTPGAATDSASGVSGAAGGEGYLSWGFSKLTKGVWGEKRGRDKRGVSRQPERHQDRDKRTR
jgi:hypothetical protein